MLEIVVSPLARPMVLKGKISEIRRRMHLANRWLQLRENDPTSIEGAFWLEFSSQVNKNFVGTAV